ncbi:hypothetical protein EDD29_0142 [Actinocorallia herbida]|uniref:Uncharacterized protein n=1 Tax=Actinocorallia herbida TaxID=58109 RepID=A0A3N1CMW7_9ACTN|nr:hypothetical protein [Actinocorallia herbida]ROO82661.1 hypothetical protein EDD29_0142 [Actinocorallia herbida]
MTAATNAAVCRCAEPDMTDDDMYQCEADDCVAHDYLAGGGASGAAAWPRVATSGPAPFHTSRFPAPGSFAIERAERYVRGELPGAEDEGQDLDFEQPTLRMRKIVNAALTAPAGQVSVEHQQILNGYYDVTCGDCETGRCHGSGPCGCDRHDVSVRWRVRGGDR